MRPSILASLVTILAGFLLADSSVAEENGAKKLVIVAGKPSHPPRMHEFNAGTQLLARCLDKVPGLKTHFVLNGWPADESIFQNADAIVFYMDGGPKHEVVQNNGSRIPLIDQWAKAGVSIGCMHYGVEVVPAQAGEPFQRWIGGFYEGMFSCNPMWEPEFRTFPTHPVTSGVQPFQIKDEWYFNMRFLNGFSADGPADHEGIKFTPILVAKPSDAVRNGPYVYPKGPYPHIQQASGRAEAMMWVVERPDGGRGFGFTGGHYHDNWANESFRKLVLNAMVWLAKVPVPANGVESTLEPGEIDQHLDPKIKK